MDSFRGANLDTQIWNPLIAQAVNRSTLYVNIDNHEYTSDDVYCFMNDNRDVMIPVSILRDAFRCSAHVYNEQELLVEKHAKSVIMRVDELEAICGTETVPVRSGLRNIQDRLYVSINDLTQLLDYTCNFDVTNNRIVVADTDNSFIFPSRYDMREKGRVSQVRNQGIYGTCWAFAATSGLESSLQPVEQNLFSVDHMSRSNSFSINPFDGGEYTMGMAYLAAWQGPVFEDDDPYGDEISDNTLSAVKHVQEMRVIDGKNYEGIKEAVFQYGGVQSSLYSTIRSAEGETEYYNRENNAYCYIGTEKSNHDVLIVGWDDNYPAENFSVPLEGDGAFLCQNSWGEEFGEAGFFYVSYYDTNIGTHNVVYTRVEDVDNYDNNYQSDLCGWVGKMGYEHESIYGANVFVAKGMETITAASFYATGVDTEYEVYVTKNFEKAKSLQNRIKVAEGKLKYAGYYTIDFEQTINVEPGEKFAIILMIKTPGATHPMAIEYDSGEEALATVDVDDGEGYISYSGEHFINVREKQECNLCIKAFTKNR